MADTTLAAAHLRPGSAPLASGQRRPDRDWLYYRVYTPSTAALDALLEMVVRPQLARLGSEGGVDRWFFLRFIDRAGPHLRLRLRGTMPAITRAERTLDRAWAGLQPPQVGDPGRPDLCCHGAGKFVYQPEVAKYGPGPGVDLAERLSQLGSVAALRCLGPDLRARRVAYAAAHMCAMLREVGIDQQTFWHQYAWYWAGGPTPGGSVTYRSILAPVLGPDAPSRAARLRAQAEAILDHPRTGDPLTSYAAEGRRLLRSPGRSDVARSDQFLLFHVMHLMNNRLGVTAWEEARIARLLWIGVQR